MTDQFNLASIVSPQQVDSLNEQFYDRFNYPADPPCLYGFSDSSFWSRQIRYSLGEWDSNRFETERLKIWIAGCGANQGIVEGLRFIDADILATDISLKSLQNSHKIANQLGLKQIEFVHQSLEQANYDSQFDVVICTGVIHHLAQPAQGMKKLHQALKPSGVLKLMVYNYYHRFLTTGFQKAMTILSPAQQGKEQESQALEQKLTMAKQLIAQWPVNNLMGRFLSLFKSGSEVTLADSLIQPVEYSYTVESLSHLAQQCQLQLLHPWVNEYDQQTGRYHWHIDFEQPDIGERNLQLSDLERWQVSNLLLEHHSPMLCFYLQRDDSLLPRQSEQQMAIQFLATTFSPSNTEATQFLIDQQGCYQQLGAKVRYPSIDDLPDSQASAVLALVDGKTSMGNIFERLNLSQDFATVNRMRVELRECLDW